MMLVLVCCLLANTALAAVSDKECSPAALWLVGCVGSLIGVVTCYYRPRLSLVTLPLFGFLFVVSGYELSDPAIAEALKRETGTMYALHAAVATSPRP